MVSRSLKKDVENISNRRKWFWGLIISLVTVCYGYYFVRYPDTLLSFSEPDTLFLPVREIGIALIISSMTKIIGIIIDNYILKKLSLIVITIIWGGLFFTGFAWSFGSGFPSTLWVDRLLILTICLRAVFKGVSTKYGHK